MKISIIAVLLFSLSNPPAYAMHIAEGYLPLPWAGLWWALALPFLLWGLRTVNRISKNNPKIKIILALAGAFAFVLSALKLPSVTGSCSHPTGTGLAAILFGPTATTVLGFIVLLFQAILLAHGGLTTLGANTFSMAIVGPFVAYGVFKLLQRMGAPRYVSVFAAAALGDLLTYICTAFQLAIAFPDRAGGILASFIKFFGIFAVTQIPLAISEGLLTVIVFNMISAYGREEIKDIEAVKGEI